MSAVACRKCGQPNLTLSLVCPGCLSRQFVGEQIDRLRVALATDPNAPVTLGRDDRRIEHAAFPSVPDLAWCGATISQQREKRRRRPASDLPETLCGGCLNAYRRMVTHETAAQ